MKKTNLISYPFLDEDGLICDHELLTDHLSSTIALACSKLNSGREKEFLLKICQDIYHINGSIRGKIAIIDSDLDFLYDEFIFYKNATRNNIKGFLLPSGSEISCILHMARCEAKTVVRNMHKIKLNGADVPKLLFDYVNLTSNALFVLAVYINKTQGIDETPFISKSYF